MPYTLRGPLPAGDYAIYAGGYQPTADAKLHAEVIWRAPAGSQVIVSADSNVGPGSDAGTPGTIFTSVSGAAVPARCGDTLLLQIKLVSGTSDYIELSANLKLP